MFFVAVMFLLDFLHDLEEARKFFFRFRAVGVLDAMFELFFRFENLGVDFFAEFLEFLTDVV